MSSVRSATSAAHRVPSHGNRRPSAAGAPLQSGAAIPGSQHCHPPQRTAGSYPSFQRTGRSRHGYALPLWRCCTIGPAT